MVAPATPDASEPEPEPEPDAHLTPAELVAAMAPLMDAIINANKSGAPCDAAHVDRLSELLFDEAPMVMFALRRLPLLELAAACARDFLAQGSIANRRALREVLQQLVPTL